MQDPKTNKVKITMQVDETTRKSWKQFCLDNDYTLTNAIKKAMKELIIKESKIESPATK